MSRHLPSFRQGALWHSLTSTSQNVPKIMSYQRNGLHSNWLKSDGYSGILGIDFGSYEWKTDTFQLVWKKYGKNKMPFGLHEWRIDTSISVKDTDSFNYIRSSFIIILKWIVCFATRSINGSSLTRCQNRQFIFQKIYNRALNVMQAVCTIHTKSYT